MDRLSEIQETYEYVLCALDEGQARQTIDSALAAGHSPQELLLRVVIPAIDHMNTALVVGQEINLAQHYLSSKISEEIAMDLLSRFEADGPPPGCMILGTAVGDYHGLGKKIVAGCLRANLFEVVDAGLHVKAERFVELALEHGAQIIGVSSMMAHTATGPDGALGVRRALRERGLEDRIKIMVGGAPFRFDHELYRQVEADAWAENGLVAVKEARRLIAQVIA